MSNFSLPGWSFNRQKRGMCYDSLFCVSLIANEIDISSCLFASCIFVENILENIGKVTGLFYFFLHIGTTWQVNRSDDAIPVPGHLKVLVTSLKINSKRLWPWHHPPPSCSSRVSPVGDKAKRKSRGRSGRLEGVRHLSSHPSWTPLTRLGKHVCLHLGNEIQNGGITRAGIHRGGGSCGRRR